MIRSRLEWNLSLTHNAVNTWLRWKSDPQTWHVSDCQHWDNLAYEKTVVQLKNSSKHLLPGGFCFTPAYFHNDKDYASADRVIVNHGFGGTIQLSYSQIGFVIKNASLPFVNFSFPSFPISTQRCLLLLCQIGVGSWTRSTWLRKKMSCFSALRPRQTQVTDSPQRTYKIDKIYICGILSTRCGWRLNASKLIDLTTPYTITSSFR